MSVTFSEGDVENIHREVLLLCALEQRLEQRGAGLAHVWTSMWTSARFGVRSGFSFPCSMFSPVPWGWYNANVDRWRQGEAAAFSLKAWSSKGDIPILPWFLQHFCSAPVFGSVPVCSHAASQSPDFWSEHESRPGCPQTQQQHKKHPKGFLVRWHQLSLTFSILSANNLTEAGSV